MSELFPADSVRRCCRCHQEKPVTAFYKRAAMRDGIDGFCKECRSAITKSYREKRKADPIPRIIPETKRCADCEETKPASEFYRNARCGDGLEMYCIPCLKARVHRNTRIRAAGDPIIHADGMKTCSRCKQPKPVAEFSVNRFYSDHLHRHCKDCDREVQRPSHRKRKYGQKAEARAAMLAAQGGVCAICRGPETHMRNGRVIELATDHIDGTKIVRGILCRRCNLVLGELNHDPALFERAAQYLRQTVVPESPTA